MGDSCRGAVGSSPRGARPETDRRSGRPSRRPRQEGCETSGLGAWFGRRIGTWRIASCTSSRRQPALPARLESGGSPSPSPVAAFTTAAGRSSGFAAATRPTTTTSTASRSTGSPDPSSAVATASTVSAYRCTSTRTSARSTGPRSGNARAELRTATPAPNTTPANRGSPFGGRPTHGTPRRGFRQRVTDVGAARPTRLRSRRRAGLRPCPGDGPRTARRAPPMQQRTGGEGRGTVRTRSRPRRERSAPARRTAAPLA